jgi:hypothetical protein
MPTRLLFNPPFTPDYYSIQQNMQFSKPENKLRLDKIQIFQDEPEGRSLGFGDLRSLRSSDHLRFCKGACITYGTLTVTNVS